MDQDRRLELIDHAIQKLINDNSDKVQGSHHDNNNNHNLKDKDHDAEYQLALSHLLSVSQLEMLKRDETLNQSEPSSPPSETAVLGSVTKKTETENSDSGNVDGRCNKGSQNDEIIKELKKVKRQNFVTHCLLSVMIVLTVAWQLSEVSLILKVKEGINHPFRSFGNMIKGIMKDKVPDMNGHVADHHNKENNNESSSFPSLTMPNIDVPNLGKE